ncbi:MAG: helix-turn-helix domain-containing protein [Clostridia bacterium]|nr:helix-turn-helix domain-containing protein [Clostridia bacterium]
MDLGQLVSIKTLDNSTKHTPYAAEIRLFSCVQQGNIDRLIEELKNLDSVLVTGKLSEDNIKNSKYLAVSTVTLATRYAIQGGLDEKTAYTFSDESIMIIDGAASSRDVFSLVARRIIQLTDMVKNSKLKPKQSPHVKKCIRYINANLNKKITVSLLADVCGVSSDYLSHIFKEEMGENLSAYILRIKLEAAKEMIANKATNREICDKLGFSSQPHFVTAFKKHCGMTPGEYYSLVK